MTTTLATPAEVTAATEALTAWLTEDDLAYEAAVYTLDGHREAHGDGDAREAQALLEWAGVTLRADLPGWMAGTIDRWVEDADGAELVAWVDDCRDSE